jgi:hypothetical protein
MCGKKNLGSFMKKDFQKIYEDNHEIIENLLSEYGLKYSVEELLNRFTDLYINKLENDEADSLNEKREHINFRLIGSQPDEKGKKKIQLVRFGKKNPASLKSLDECYMFIEIFKQLREFKKIESYEKKVEETIEKLKSQDS